MPNRGTPKCPTSNTACISAARLKKGRTPYSTLEVSKTLADKCVQHHPQVWVFSVGCFAQAYKNILRRKCDLRRKVSRGIPPPWRSKNQYPPKATPVAPERQHQRYPFRAFFARGKNGAGFFSRAEAQGRREIISHTKAQRSQRIFFCRYFLLFTFYILPITYHLLLITYHLSPITFFISPPCKRRLF